MPPITPLQSLLRKAALFGESIRARSAADRASGLEQISEATLALNRRDSDRIHRLMSKAEQLRAPPLVQSRETPHPSWWADTSPEQRAKLEGLRGWDTSTLGLRAPSEDLYRSADANFFDYEVVPKVRSVKMSELGDLPGYNTDKDVARIRALSDAIRQSSEIEPIFVGLHPSGEMYIVEGQHRARAFRDMGIPEIPAHVIVDME